MIGHDNVGWAMLDGVLFYFFPFLFFLAGLAGRRGGGICVLLYYCILFVCSMKRK